MKELLKAKAKFRQLGVTLIADRKKDGAGGSWKFAGEDNLIRTVQAPLIDCGLEIITTMDGNKVVATMFHVVSGESISSSIDLTTVIPRKDKNGNDMYLDSEIERGKQFGYWSRTLTIRLLGLSDIDPEDMDNRPQDMSDDTIEMRGELNTLVGATKDPEATKQWIYKNYNVQAVEILNAVNLKHVINLLKQKSKA